MAMAYNKVSATINETQQKMSATIISGRDGISPIVSLEHTEDGLVITIVDAEGEKSATIPAADVETIKRIVDEEFAEEMESAEFYDLVDELPQDPDPGHIYVLREEEE